MKKRIFVFTVVAGLIFAGVLSGAFEKNLDLPLGTRMENPAPDRMTLVLPDGGRLELTGGMGVQTEFRECILYDATGKMVARGMKAQFVNPSVEKLVVLPSGVRLVAIDDDVVWARQGAPVPPGSYLRIGAEVIWLPAKIKYLPAPDQIQSRPPPRKPHLQPK